MIQRRVFALSSSTLRRKVSTHSRIVFLALLVAASGIFLTVDARPQGQVQPRTANQATKKKHRLRVTKGYITTISLKADKAKMPDIAADLGKRLGAQVILGPSLRKKKITVEFYDLPLEPALQLLAPKAYVDYEVRAHGQPTVMGIFLMDQDDPDPVRNAVVQGSSEAMLIEGNTEDTGESSETNSEDYPLQVDAEDNRLTIKSKKQLLVVVLMTIAEALGVPSEIKDDTRETVDAEIQDTPFEDAILRLSPNIRLFVRADLNRSQRTPLRIKLVPSAKVADSAANQ